MLDKEKERSQNVFEHVASMHKETGAGSVDGYIDRAHRIGKSYFGLTKKRHSLLKSPSNLVKDVDRVLFCYADINCRLKIKWRDESREDDFFTSIDDLKSHLEGLI